MIEWIQHWDEMRFYYQSGLSNLILIPTYVGGFLVIMVVCWGLGKVWKPLWLLAIPALAYLAVAPMWEEFGIAYNFGQLCKKDAGIFIEKTVEVAGFYDATAVATKVLDPVPQQAAEHWDKLGYQFYEKGLADTRGGPTRTVHYEKRNGVWKGEVFDQPSARYHYRWPHMNTVVSHKVVKTEQLVADTLTDEVLARYVNYGREGPWFFVGLDMPLMLCEEAERDARKRGTVFGPRMVLLPAQKD